MTGAYTYANGMNISQSRKLFKFYFGDFFFKAEKNDKKLRFDVYLKKLVKSESGILKLEDCVDIDYFNEYWNGDNVNNPPFNLLILDVEVQKMEIKIILSEELNKDIEFLTKVENVSIDVLFDKAINAYINQNSGCGKFKFQDIPSLKPKK